MALRTELLAVLALLADLRKTILARAEEHIATIMPGYTHGQHAQPITFGYWLASAADALARDPELNTFGGRVSDSGEGRWTILAAIEEGVPAPVLSSALYERFSSRNLAEYADKICSAMRFEFGGHLEKPAGSK
jgi:6-phosphogluconate dehydrogenase